MLGWNRFILTSSFCINNSVANMLFAWFVSLHANRYTQYTFCIDNYISSTLSSFVRVQLRIVFMVIVSHLSDYCLLNIVEKNKLTLDFLKAENNLIYLIVSPGWRWNVTLLLDERDFNKMNSQMNSQFSI